MKQGRHTVGAIVLATFVLGCGMNDLDSIMLAPDTEVELTDKTLYAAEAVDTLSHEGGIAEGAILPLGVLCDCDFAELDFESDNPATLALTEASGDVARFIAAESGEASIFVRTEEVEETAVVQVRAIAESQVELLPWIPQFKLPESLWAEGIAILPDTNVTLAGIHYSEDGLPLGGYGATDWKVESDMTAAGVVMKKNMSDMVIFRSGSKARPAEHVSFGKSEPLTLETVEEDAITTLELYYTSSLFEVTPDGDVISDGEYAILEGPSLLHAILRTESGKYVIGEGQGQLAVVDVNTGENMLDSSGPLEDSMSAGRAAIMKPLETNEARTLEVSYGEKSITVTLRGAATSLD